MNELFSGMNVKQKPLTTGEITELALARFDSLGFECWRQNQIPQRGRTFRGKKGLSDIIGIRRNCVAHPGGEFFCCEVKKYGDAIYPEQEDFLIMINQNGGFGYLAEGHKDGSVTYRLYTSKDPNIKRRSKK